MTFLEFQFSQGIIIIVTNDYPKFSTWMNRDWQLKRNEKKKWFESNTVSGRSKIRTMILQMKRFMCNKVRHWILNWKTMYQIWWLENKFRRCSMLSAQCSMLNTDYSNEWSFKLHPQLCWCLSGTEMLWFQCVDEDINWEKSGNKNYAAISVE